MSFLVLNFIYCYHPHCLHRQIHPGYSMFEWNKLCHSGRDMSGTKGKILKVSPEELAKHDSDGDVWTCVRGKMTKKKLEWYCCCFCFVFVCFVCLFCCCCCCCFVVVVIVFCCFFCCFCFVAVVVVLLLSLFFVVFVLLLLLSLS